MTSRIQSCIDHIKTSVDIDPWAAELAEKALRQYESRVMKLDEVKYTSTLLDIPPDRRAEGGDTVELKNCPFCGHEAAMQTVTTAMEKVPRFRVICPMCRIQTDWDFWKPEDVAEHWNRRTHETD